MGLLTLYGRPCLCLWLMHTGCPQGWLDRVRPGETACSPPPPPEGIGPGSPPAPSLTRKGRFLIHTEPWSPYLGDLPVDRLPPTPPRHTHTQSHTCRHRMEKSLLSYHPFWKVVAGEDVGLNFLGSEPDHWGSHSAPPRVTSLLCASVFYSEKWAGASSCLIEGLGGLSELIQPKH